MSNPSDYGLAEYTLLNGEEFEVECELEEMLAFMLGEPPYLRFDMEPDKTGVAKFTYIPASAIATIVWHDNQLARKRRQKGKK